MLPLPHGGKLVSIPDMDLEKFSMKELEHSLEISYETAITILGIKSGILSPLKGFLAYSDYIAVMRNQRLDNGLPWSIPTLLTVHNETSISLKEGEHVILAHNRVPIAELEISDIFELDKQSLSKSVFGTLSPDHPGVQKINSYGNMAIGGRLVTANYVSYPFSEMTVFPEETRKLFNTKGWKSVTAFQTRNVPHRGHEEIQRLAMRNSDGLFINPVIGKKKAGDYTDDAILSSYRALIDYYYPKDRVLMTPLHYEMMYAGPREAVMHAIMRKNYGCTHFIVGRDHAGVGDFYGPYDAQKNLSSFNDLGIEIVPYQETFYCKRCEQLVTDKECPHSQEQKEHFSGTGLRKIILSNGSPPRELMREEVFHAIKSIKDPFVH